MTKYIFYDFCGYNGKLFLLLNELLSSHHVQLALQILTNFFGIENFALYYLIFLAIYYFRSTKQNNNHNSNSYEGINFVIQIGIIYLLVLIIYSSIKFGVRMPRPFCNEMPGTFTTILDTSKQRCTTSFPSSHVAISILCVYSIWHFLAPFLKIVSIVIIVLTALSRIGLAMHYPADILYSCIIMYFIINLSSYINNIIGIKYAQKKKWQ